MKKFSNILKYSGLAFAMIVGMAACDKTLEEPQRVGYSPANVDDKAGTWKTYLLTSAEEINVPAPTSVTSPEYVAELAALKGLSNTLTKEQQEAVVYWGAGAVYRWNEIARELAARYNIPPASNADGKYPVPDAANPLADPKFPFANPPYTARALAYLSVAQYDALVSAWNYKYKYKRAAPSKVDATLRVALPVSALPSYPSEDAVVAAASVTILKAMFPGEVPYLEAKMKEHLEARQWAGMNVQSDLTAGTALGGAVAAKVMGRARTDGMSAANNQALTAGMIEAAKSRGIKETWLSQEVPIRPPMLPNYGAVQTWNFDKATLAQIRPAIPYVVGSAEWQKDFDELSKINKNQTREQARIANYWADGAGSYTPPGHWHRAAANAAHEARFSEVRMARTLALLGTAEMDAGIACWEAKFYYYTPRPQQFGLKTSVGLPNFPSYTSGHSTFSAAAATVLGYIFPEQAEKFKAQADEASVSRIYGLIHYRVDCEMGLKHGNIIGNYAIARGKADGSGL
ncbi:phosphatase PAP2 family protein [Runella salmonicolor]|uniref:Phosphatase PAP2 family protein n=1 Tax=Runella salmonicolor TaxID=2950278 RepID=A0ABT1FQ22_9BACT|nr:phosphatase PAP2 family protein [Runella salmonicolor]MCP1383869.1 phosphatase PAP2 family protein [Runella salmonicolor]